MAEEKKGAWDNVKKGVAVFAAAVTMALAGGGQEVNAASHQKNDRDETVTVMRFGKSLDDKVKNPKLWKPKRDKKEIRLPNIPGATHEEKVEMYSLNKRLGELHRLRGDAKFFKNKAEEERLTREILSISIQQHELRGKIANRQKQAMSSNIMDNENMQEHKQPITTMKKMKDERPSWKLTPEEKENYDVITGQKLQDFQKNRREQIMKKRGFDPEKVDMGREK